MHALKIPKNRLTQGWVVHPVLCTEATDTTSEQAREFLNLMIQTKTRTAPDRATPRRIFR